MARSLYPISSEDLMSDKGRERWLVCLRQADFQRYGFGADLRIYLTCEAGEGDRPPRPVQPAGERGVEGASRRANVAAARRRR